VATQLVRLQLVELTLAAAVAVEVLVEQAQLEQQVVLA
jgi:hypothetical protein